MGGNFRKGGFGDFQSRLLDLDQHYAIERYTAVVVQTFREHGEGGTVAGNGLLKRVKASRWQFLREVGRGGSWGEGEDGSVRVGGWKTVNRRFCCVLGRARGWRG